MKEVCYQCGLPESHDIHRKSFGGAGFSMGVDGKSVYWEATERYHAPWQHTYEPGELRRKADLTDHLGAS